MGKTRESDVRRGRVLLTVLLAAVALAPGVNTIAITNDSATLRQTPARDVAEAGRLNAEVLRLINEGRYDEAIPIAQRVLTTLERVLGPQHPHVATSLNNLALLYKSKGEYARAEPLYLRALSIREKTLGAQHPEVAISLNNLAALYDTAGYYAKAEPLYWRALAITEKTLGPGHPNVATLLNNLAWLYDNTGEYAKAESLYRRALAIREKALGPGHPAVAQSLNNLAAWYDSKGDFAKAEPLYLRALAIRERVLGAGHPDTATSLNNLAELYWNKGDYTKAEPLYLRALAIREKTFGAEHPDVGQLLNNLAALYKSKGEYARAEPLYRRSLVIREKALGPGHPDVATSLNNLAALYDSQGDYARAEPLYLRALAVSEKALGPQHPDVAQSLNNLAGLYLSAGDYARAEPLYLRALTITEKALGAAHPTVAGMLYNLAESYRGKGDYQRAVACRTRANEIRERDLARNLAFSSERQRLLYLENTSGGVDFALSLHTINAPKDVAASRMAMAALFSRKGRALDAMSDTLAQVRRRATPQDRALIEQYAAALTRLSQATLAGPGSKDLAQYKAGLDQLRAQIETLETRISLDIQFQPVTFAAVQQAIPPGTVLIEFASFVPYEAGTLKAKPRRYVAYALRQQGEPSWADLGEAEPIDQAVNALREALRDRRRTDVKQLARALDARVMQPVRRLVGQTRHLLISPDGLLNLVPFAALVDENNHYLVENYTLSYLTSGRDLLRMQARAQSRQGAMVVADPDFGEPRAQAGRPGVTTGRAFDLSKAYFSPLPGTAEEAAALKAILPGAAVLTRAEATEAALKRASGPSVLHIATHGFFLEDAVVGEVRGQNQRRLLLQEEAVPAGRLENPLLRSGLGLAGANLRKSGEDDGILTALEVAGLDLWGTRLVVLSACDTGVGEVKNGEGVYGLRRALVLAGAETQMMSLWPVSDTGTRDLMIEYYKALRAGQGRSEGLRQVQLRMLGDPQRQHPYYWASFIQSGEWANLEGRR
ncbi:MAG TPA: CHAT domain-containing tetratricopeptide repeat protein [Blastocatellia bacterium]|nr:CHAT domain-containing tetratricopeptide repeat protein [Blastocatellia bacterium]